MRFRPSHGLGGGGGGNKPDRAASEARAEVLGEKAPETVFDEKRHEQEIQRAENVAAGLPPETPPETAEPGQEDAGPQKGDFRQPHMDTPEEVQE